MNDLLLSLLVYNVSDDEKRYQCHLELKRTKEWGSFVRRLSRLENGTGPAASEASVAVWDQIKRRLVDLKVTELARVENGWFEQERQKISRTGNRATLPGELLRLGIESMRRWAKRLWEIYAEVWTKQGREKTPAFVWTVFERAIVPAIDARAAVASEHLRSHAALTHARVAPHLLELQRMVERLKGEWRGKAEIEAIELGLRQTEPATKSQSHPRSKWYESGPDVVKRRQIVLRNPSLSASSLCKVFDAERIGLPSRWEQEFNLATWIEAYKVPKLRARIQRIISTDRVEK